MHKVNIEGNQAKDGAGGAIWASNGQDLTAINVTDSTFVENYSSQSNIKLDQVASMEVTNCIFVNNKAESVTHGFQLSQSNLKLFNTLIKN